ncbi:MAG: hypothetical protein GX593_07805 [Actinomycetales bacterium]|nr:hypothetical protein [Actinomycetales bacterium]
MNTASPAPSTARIGVDIGRVIINGDGQADTPFLGTTDELAMLSPAVYGSFDAVAELLERTEGAVWLVSKCGTGIEHRTRLWLEHHDFFELTGMDRSHALFCRERRQKTPIAKRLGLTHFVDDRHDVLEPMVGVVEHLLHFGAPEEPSRYPGLVPTPTWDHALDVIRPTL